MKSISPKPWFAPQPVLIIGTYNKEGAVSYTHLTLPTTSRV